DFFAEAADKDVIFLAGHGNTDLWDIIGANEVRDSFSPVDTAPLVYAASCLTGRFRAFKSLAERFLEKGASLYIGATENGIWPYGKHLTNAFFDRIRTTDTVGSAFKYAKRHRANQGCRDTRRFNEYNCAVFHLYGNPKQELGRAARVAEAPASSSMQGPLAELSLIIPDYKVTQGDPYDTVAIPDGTYVLTPGFPEVPAYRADIEFPAGFEVQDVRLRERGGLVTDSDIKLADVELALPGAEQINGKSAAADWWPQDDFTWHVSRETGRRTTLSITIHPFFYQESTSEVRFYKEFDFVIDYIASPLAINDFVTDKQAYELGETVSAQLYFNNSSGKPFDVIVEACVSTEVLDEKIGLPLRVLREVQGLSACTFTWESSASVIADYLFEVNIRDSSGRLLAAESTPFFMGDPELLVEKLFFQHVVSDGDWQTEIGIINSSPNQNLVGLMKAYDNSGVQVSESISVGLDPHARREFMVGESFIDADKIGYLVFESDSTTTVGYMKFFIDGQYRVAIPAQVNSNQGDLFLSHIASSSEWWTGVSLVNTTTAGKNLTLEFDDGTRKSLNLAAGEHKIFTVKSLFAESARPDLNSAVIRGGSGIVGFELF
ncbi:MAG: C25 family cysteine peptidase, partial [Pseudomonadota bacterium]|nr:C25 family cysteine peptidase [Pseudomonadota bacterium]